jgi:hypothetical protein
MSENSEVFVLDKDRGECGKNKIAVHLGALEGFPRQNRLHTAPYIVMKLVIIAMDHPI